MKKILFLLLTLLLCVALTGCGEKKAEDTSSAPANMESVLPGSNLAETPTEETTGNEAFVTAKKYIDKSVDELISAIGEPVKREYSPSCLGKGEDGNLEYDGFFVYTYKEGGSEVVKDVYQ